MSQSADYAVYNLSAEGDAEYLPGINFYRHCAGRKGNAKPVLIYQPLGNIWVAVERAAKELKILTLAKVISLTERSRLSRPPFITERTKQLGARHSPEFICYPYKAILGYLFSSAQRFEGLREDFLYPLYLSHEGPLCREKAYGRLQEVKLRELYQAEFQNQDFDFYIVKESLDGLFELVALFQQFSGKSFLEVANIINSAIKRLDIVERFENEVRRCESLGADFWAAEKILEEMKEAMVQDEISSSEVLRQAQKKLRELHMPRSKLKIIYITGEIFHIEEAESCSGDVLREIARRGFYPHKRVGIGHYTPRFQLTPSRFARFLLVYFGFPAFFRFLRSFLARFGVSMRYTLKELARKKGGLSRDAGGHSVDTVGLRVETIEDQVGGKATCQGVVELFPFNCLPQVVAANVMMNLKGGVPWLRLGCDEQTGRAGVLTRLEAFLSLLETNEKRNKKIV